MPGLLGCRNWALAVRRRVAGMRVAVGVLGVALALVVALWFSDHLAQQRRFDAALANIIKGRNAADLACSNLARASAQAETNCLLRIDDNFRKHCAVNRTDTAP